MPPTVVTAMGSAADAQIERELLHAVDLRIGGASQGSDDDRWHNASFSSLGRPQGTGDRQ